MIEAEGAEELYSKRKAFATLLPYAIWQERDGRSEILNAFTRAARASRVCGFTWERAEQFSITLLSGASPRAVALASPHIYWDAWDLIPQWAAKVSAAPHTEGVARSVVEGLFQIASEDELLSQLPGDVWSWLTGRPSLPPFCQRRRAGTRAHVVEIVRALNDIEILKSYFFVTWSEWGQLKSRGFIEMCTAIREDFGGIGMRHHRADLIQRLVYILRQLDRGLEYLKQHNPELKSKHLETMKKQYRTLEEVLLEVENRKSPSIVTLFCRLTPAEMYRISRNVYVRSSAPVSIVSLWISSRFLALFSPDFCNVGRVYCISPIGFRTILVEPLYLLPYLFRAHPAQYLHGLWRITDGERSQRM
jgi:hypothetical protein